jgi:hypothetical protein
MPTFSAAVPLARLLTAVGLVASIAACKGFTDIDASFQNVTTVDTLYAINGGPPGAPNVIQFFNSLQARADQGFGYDVALDIDKDGKIVVIPVKALATTFSNPYSVGLQRVTGSFQSVLEAPEEGYRADTSMTVNVGETVVVESRDIFGVCTYALKGQAFYSKLVVTNVDPVLRRIAYTMTVNRNCGFRSFAPGIPED